MRLWQGEKDKEVVYSLDPVAVAKMWVKKGAKRLHIVDLDGAWRGEPQHLKIVERIAKEVDVPLEFGGGIRSFFILKEVLKRGIKYAILGSKALSPEFVKKACKKFRERIIVSLDVREGKVATEGWEKQTFISAEDLCKELTKIGISTIIFTDISRDGTLRGVNTEEIRKFMEECRNVDLIISGGISSLEDIKKIGSLSTLRIIGIIIGKALYDKKIRLEEAISLGKEY
ncbi:1-(5-phosphoribosyl)-5-((5-phosphoribosylamino)methylideneamino)imidazole-4-carboxamide isomerase [Candidatus Aerophobetes bacterium]|nr:1-(5-phosphoribosyl)-5-((5-phosphoribosylamino)methylideneamino)imidazole-4-carboxamide isomerase [Candidatus Aerophobetes bacterium]